MLITLILGTCREFTVFFKEVKVESFWADGPCLIYLLRRFGCQICRWQAKAFSELAPQLKERNVRMIAIGPERLGWEEFVQGHFWDGGTNRHERITKYSISNFHNFF